MITNNLCCNDYKKICVVIITKIFVYSLFKDSPYCAFKSLCKT